jgi:copper(I)-binding protein
MTRLLLPAGRRPVFHQRAGASHRHRPLGARHRAPGQKVAGAFMQLQSAKAVRLVGVSTPVAGRAELHQMAMENNTMRMRQVDAIDLPAGKPVNLASGGYHVMLFDLKRQLKEGETVPVTLVVQDAANKRSSVTVEAQVKPLTYVAPAAGHHALIRRVGGSPAHPTKTWRPYRRVIRLLRRGAHAAHAARADGRLADLRIAVIIHIPRTGDRHARLVARPDRRFARTGHVTLALVACTRPGRRRPSRRSIPTACRSFPPPPSGRRCRPATLTATRFRRLSG